MSLGISGIIAGGFVAVVAGGARRDGRAQVVCKSVAQELRGRMKDRSAAAANKKAPRQRTAEGLVFCILSIDVVLDRVREAGLERGIADDADDGGQCQQDRAI